MVFDYDGTLTLENGLLPEPTKKILHEIKRLDLALLGIVSGRDLEFLLKVNESLSRPFSFLVAENGAVSYFANKEEKLVKGIEWTREARRAFSTVDFPIHFFEIIASSKKEFSSNVSVALNESHLEAKIVLNKDSIMVLPPNVDKGTGVSSAIEHYAQTKNMTLTCFGDGENDEALFGPADHSVAVSNAVPSLKKIADSITTQPGGLGVVEYLTSKFHPFAKSCLED